MRALALILVLTTGCITVQTSLPSELLSTDTQMEESQTVFEALTPEQQQTVLDWMGMCAFAGFALSVYVHHNAGFAFHNWEYKNGEKEGAVENWNLCVEDWKAGGVVQSLDDDDWQWTGGMMH